MACLGSHAPSLVASAQHSTLAPYNEHPFCHRHFSRCYWSASCSRSYSGFAFLTTTTSSSPSSPSTPLRMSAYVKRGPCAVCSQLTTNWCSRCQNCFYCSPQHLQSVSHSQSPRSSSHWELIAISSPPPGLAASPYVLYCSRGAVTAASDAYDACVPLRLIP